ncbi:MAG: DUF3618 domain-containing protein [Pseudonocardiaceae bacterium]|nr:MAG: DUF3618 domain-containing protein [Pseudonocardiaceae bacterium]
MSPTREQREQLVESERAELAETIDELGRRASPAVLLAPVRERAQRWAVPAGAVVAAVLVLKLVVGRLSRRRR